MAIKYFRSVDCAPRKHRDLLGKRCRAAEATDVPSWDRKQVSFAAFIGPLVFSGIVGLDHRFGWPSSVSDRLQWIALLLFVPGNAMAVWAMAANFFFSAVVRIRHEPGQTVLADGPYRRVRHPAFAGGILSYPETPPLLDAMWALIPAVATSAVVLGTWLEDRELLQRLQGDGAYAVETTSRLMPGIW